MSIPRPSLTVGIEEEYQLIDPKTRELSSVISQVMEGDTRMLRQTNVKPELHQSMIEIGTTACATVAEARRELIGLRRSVSDLAQSQGARIVAAGTHPFSSWQTQTITPKERYWGIEQDYQALARDLLIFGMHVHIGVEDPEFAVDAMNVLRYMAPHVLALSTSSPLWEGRDTGLKSYRSALFRRFPRTGIPATFASHGEFERFVATLVKTGCLEDGSKLYWDVRPHHQYPTLEFRICDPCTHVDDAICCAALFQALVYKHYTMRKDNISFKTYPTPLIEENKWRAMRYGVQGKLIDFNVEQQHPAATILGELVAFVDDVLDELGTRKEVEHVFTILARGTSADQQLAIFRETGDPKAVVDWLAEETLRGCELPGCDESG